MPASVGLCQLEIRRLWVLIEIDEQVVQLLIFSGLHLNYNDLYNISMSMTSIASIKVPNGFKFDLEKAEKSSPVKKQATFCEVNLLRYNDVRYALKIIHKKMIAPDKYEEQYRRVANEINILYKLNHPNIIKLYYHQQTENDILLLLEYGGTRLKAHFKSTFHAEDEVKMITKQILEGLKYLHDEGYIHRDLEPENILLNKQQQRVKIIDFGFIDELKFRKTKIGSFFYMAPEVTGDDAYNQKVDIWSLGVIVYEMLHQDLPFCSYKKLEPEAYSENMRKMNINFDSQLSDKVVSFIKRMLVLDPERRASAAELLRHEFIEPQVDLSPFDREGTSKTHKYQYNREKSEVKMEESIEQLQGHLKKTIREVFACFHHQRDTLSELFKTYRTILNKNIEEKQRR